MSSHDSTFRRIVVDNLIALDPVMFVPMVVRVVVEGGPVVRWCVEDSRSSGTGPVAMPIMCVHPSLDCLFRFSLSALFRRPCSGSPEVHLHAKSLL